MATISPVDFSTALGRRIQDNRSEEISRFAAELRGGFDPGIESDFRLAINAACSGYGIDPAAVADAFGVSAGTVSRWRNGRSMPPKYARQSIVERLADLLVAQLEDTAAASPQK